MRAQKIRGHTRRHRHIEAWRSSHLALNTDFLKEHHYNYTKVSIHPWCDISLLNSAIPAPRGKTKQLILSGLLDIYENWKAQLDQLAQPYYLKIWWYAPNFQRSQVVCAIGERINHYETSFYTPGQIKSLDTKAYGKLSARLENYNWNYFFEENHYFNDEVGLPEHYASLEDYEDYKKWFEQLLKKPHRTEKLQEVIGESFECYSFKQGDLWIGQKNNFLP